ncbi:DUF3348 domain-containing protein [Thauera sinica]|uniref:DUF3348 domain-containing protein n=1 Tax=Thauera sinica TaxID=2665146 RepID=A0ABW1AX92_9RHOO|nr:DUF3348 domain-containing protein [Thauera sp. K11]ATE61214.1 hypothetical protein CCZ27_15820 [Thauera sp. K11]
MAQGLPRTHFNSAGLVRLLSGLAVADVAEARQSFAERLGDWLDFTHALSLYSALDAAAGESGAPAAAPSPARQAFARVRGTLAESITIDGVQNPGKARIALPAPLPHDTVESASDFGPYHRYYLAHQRDMNANVGPLRATVRAALSRQSPVLARLAALDAAMDQALADRERTLLATVPALLAGRFERLFQAHRAARADAETADDPARWMEPGGWLARFCGEMRAVLLAELELRLQPVAGLIEALDNEVEKQQ